MRKKAKLFPHFWIRVFIDSSLYLQRGYVLLLLTTSHRMPPLEDQGCAVGRPVTCPPPHSSRRAVVSHRALQPYSLPHGGFWREGCRSRLGPANDPWSGHCKADIPHREPALEAFLSIKPRIPLSQELEQVLVLVGQIEHQGSLSRDGELMNPHEVMEHPACGRVLDALAFLVRKGCPVVLGAWRMRYSKAA